MKKKILFLLFIVLMIGIVLSGCENKKDIKNDETSKLTTQATSIDYSQVTSLEVERTMDGKVEKAKVTDSGINQTIVVWYNRILKEKDTEVSKTDITKEKIIESYNITINYNKNDKTNFIYYIVEKGENSVKDGVRGEYYISLNGFLYKVQHPSDTLPIALFKYVDYK